MNAALLDDLTGERNVVLGCLAMGMPPAEVKALYPSIVEFSGVGNFVDLPMRAYSTGMAQRLRFAIASAKSHEILMIDEALATGDAAFRTKSHNRIKELRDEAGTVFLVAHNLGEIEQSCNRVIWMEVEARSCATATTSRASSTSTSPPPAASPATASRPACSWLAAAGCLLPVEAELGLAADVAEGQPHDGAALRAGLGDDGAVLGEGVPGDDVEADADAADAAAVARLALHEALEDALVVAR